MIRKIFSRLYSLMNNCGLFYPARAIANMSSPVKFVWNCDNSRRPRGYYFFGNDTALVQTHYRQYLMLDVRDLSVASTIITTGWYEPWIEILLRSLLKPGMTYLNAGANFGYHTMLGAMLVGESGHAYGFEPNLHIFHLLKRASWVNGFSPRMTLYNAAVFDEEGTADFLFVVEHQGGAGLGDTDQNYMATKSLEGSAEIDASGKSSPTTWSPYRKAVVKQVTIDSTVGRDIAQLNVLHMDIERSEGPALLGARDLIRRSPNIKIVIEQSPVLPPPIAAKYKQALDFLVEQGFVFYMVRPPSYGARVRAPHLVPVARADLLRLPHCDLFITRT
jgi:FkbM family methyltransferase